MTKVFATATSIILLITGVNGQTAAELAKKYHHHEVYEVQPGVQMTPRFDSSGSVCEMQVEQTHFGPDRAELYDDLDEHKVFAIIDKLVPASERGIEGNTAWECMGVCQMTHQFENVVIDVLSSGHTRLVTIKWRKRTCE